MDQWKEEFNLGYETPQSCQVSGTSNEAVWVPLKCQKKAESIRTVSLGLKCKNHQPIRITACM